MNTYSPVVASPVASAPASEIEGDHQTAETASWSADAVKPLAELFKLLSDETRLRILALLVDNVEMHVRALCDVLGQSQPAVSHHLALLRIAGIIECRRDGKHNFYRAAPQRAQGLLDLIFAEVPAIRRRIRPGQRG